MPFDWMHVPHTTDQKQRARAHKVLLDEYRGQAALLRRLGYAKAVALRRCSARAGWDQSPGHPPRVSEDELRALVDAVYA